MINATVTGRLGKDPELKETRKGGQMLRFNVASDQGWGDNKSTNWVGVVVFGKRAETLARILEKGTFVIVRGEFTTRTDEGTGRTYFDLKADDVELGPRAPRGDSQPYVEASSTGNDSDIPF